MKRICGALWQTVRMHVSHWFVGGAVGAAIGASPDKWFEELFRVIHAPEEAIHLGSLGLDFRWVFIVSGGAVMLADILAHMRAHGSSHDAAAQAVAVTVAPQISVSPQVTQAPQNTFAPQNNFAPQNTFAPQLVLTRDALAGLIPPETSSPSDTDKCVVLPYRSLGSLFKGRDTFMRWLRASLIRPDGGTAAIASSAMFGLGGVGKTRAAVEYAWAHRADYSALVLLDAGSPEKLQTGLAALAGPLRLPEQAAPEETIRMEAALAWLNANPGWFLILDNVDSDLALTAANRLLGRLQGGHVVLTSRLATGFARGMERLDLDVLSPDDAAYFLLEATATARRKAPDDAAQARALAEELGRSATRTDAGLAPS